MILALPDSKWSNCGLTRDTGVSEQIEVVVTAQQGGMDSETTIFKSDT